MPFDVRDFPGAPPEDRAAGRRSRRLVATWLFAVAFMVLVMIVLGGVTRLTGSGLSIMEWAPFAGTLPPMNDAEWQRLYHLYQQIPQYALVNDGLGLAGFKRIFWLEWTHRLWGRLIGLAFIVPLIWFWASGRIERRLRPRLALLFVLGGLQGAVGWFMVASGFEPRCDHRIAVPSGGPSGARPDPLRRHSVDRPYGAAANAAAALGQQIAALVGLGLLCMRRADHAGGRLRRRNPRGPRLQHVSADGWAAGAAGLRQT